MFARASWLVILAGCGASSSGLDAPAAVDAAVDGASVDAAVDATPDATCAPILLVGGQDATAQGWTAATMAPATVTLGADYTELATSTTSGATTGGQLLLARADAVPTGAPFRVEVELRLISGGAHNPSDAGAAILGSFTAPFGTVAERAQMIYLAADGLGWADGGPPHAIALTDGQYHVVELAVDAAQVATVTVDGTAALTRTGFVTTGTIAIGDQSNEPGLDGTMRIRRVQRRCP